MKNKFVYFNKQITRLEDNQVFCFGSNLAGRHSAGADAAYIALRFFGAEYGEGAGFTGRCYAIPTKDKNIKTLPLDEVKVFVDSFVLVTHQLTDKEFIITQIGRGRDGYKASQIAPLFKGCNPDNTLFDIEWREYLE